MVKARLYLLLCTCVYFFFPLNINCQGKIDTIPDFKVLTIAKSVVENGKQQSNELYTHTLKRLQAMDCYEKKLLKKMPDATRNEATQRLDDINEKIRQIEFWQNDPKKLLEQGPGGPYISRIDSLQTMFSFAMPKIANNELLQQAQENLTLLKAQLGQSIELESWMEARRETWISLLKPGGLTDKLKLPAEFTRWQQEAHTYKAQIQHYRETIQDGSKLEKEALRWLNKLPAFSEFMSKHGELARLFGPPQGAAQVPQGTLIPGLQTRQGLAQELTRRFGEDFLANGGVLQQRLQEGMEQVSAIAGTNLDVIPGLDNLKQHGAAFFDKFNEALNPAQKEMAELKALPLKKRFEVMWNIQSATRLQNFPSVRDVGISVGYKAHPRITTGVGLAYKFALGEDWKHIHWTHEGFGFRSFLEWRLTSAEGKMFKNIWLMGGYEMNYWERIGNDVQWKHLAWQKSGLVGVGKKVSFGKKRGKILVLWEALKMDADKMPFVVRWNSTF